MSDRIYVLSDGDELVTLSQHQYDSEDLLQTLLEKYPDILPGYDAEPSGRCPWVLVKREAGVPDTLGGGGRWSVDHLFLDRSGIPTLVEVKRSTDSRIRREVVGQMLDYAANALTYWSIEALRASFETTCRERGTEAEIILAEFLGEDANVDTFWQTVKTNLQAGRVRLLFVSDEIPEELRRVVEFLNSQMDPAEVLAVKIKQYAGETLKTLVPRIIGHTAEAERRKSVGAKTSRQWDEETFLSCLEYKCGPARAEVARALLTWAHDHADRVKWGGGSSDGSLFPIVDRSATVHTPFIVWTYGRVELQLQHIATRPPFDSQECHQELVRRFNGIPGIDIPEDKIRKRPGIALESLADEAVRRRFFDVVEWYIDEVRKSPLS